MKIAVGLGSNLGDRLAMLASAVRMLDEAFLVARVSHVYETAPVGGPEQGPYLNAAALVVAQSPHAVFARAMEIERELGRERRERWGPRTIDLDVLWAEQPVDQADLVVPHPRLVGRPFAVVPLVEILPELGDTYSEDSRALGAPFATADALFVPRSVI